MRFSLVDRIIDVKPGKEITAVKALSLCEEYLADHFPNFPVLPGVLMLEALTQSAAWLVRITEDFAHSIVVLKEAKRVRFGQFVEPGQVLQVRVEILRDDGRLTEVQAEGMLNGKTTVSARLVMERYNLAERDPTCANLDDSVKRDMRKLLSLLLAGGKMPNSEPPKNTDPFAGSRSVAQSVMSKSS
ncbi:3-hydroxyacyl-[acyl-carrier-protein] dehydratase, FabZ form [Thermogutta terrifontis]|jgi:3-hydroxyacyl-[acyl-carrier-protein] dehydratase|uniref:3-hydroxyacyl-[acyl-carrier-protein] dehydratase, FabZ form n=1 Tax=Thermogutta terrifontis TaxID=1331910 RepID=A0A286RJQ5_9BACT|nr:3-hydroxyacyl-ACP dehydratase FabZ family protein [Thermogutta terrifontis]ASV76132.1 3-hydroxyacyl-[acyl-carrier-protein] dehydratase, FabZ form [Thermogutta terrifontis]